MNHNDEIKAMLTQRLEVLNVRTEAAWLKLKRVETDVEPYIHRKNEACHEWAELEREKDGVASTLRAMTNPIEKGEAS